MPTVVYNKVSSSKGTGVMAVSPGHDIDSLKIASVYNLPKHGILDKDALIISEYDMPAKLIGQSVGTFE